MTRYISLFSGIEAASVAFAPLGWVPVAFSEIDKFACALLAQRYPGVPNVGDVTKCDWSEYEGKADVVIGGSPCQSFSVAGLRQSMKDPRGNLTLAYIAAAHAIRPRYAIWENVPGVLSTHDNAFGCFLAGLVGSSEPIVAVNGWTGAGVVSGPLGQAAWRILDAQYFCLAQRRERVFVVASFGGVCPAEILFEWEGLRRDSPPRREAGERTAPTIAARVRGGGGLGPDAECDGALIPAVSMCLNGGGMNRIDGESETFIPLVAGTLAASGAGSERAAGNANETDMIVARFHSFMEPTMSVRRLTPRECERLQGFEDDYTLIEIKGKPAKDGPRYKAIGNSMATTVINWIGRRIMEAL